MIIDHHRPSSTIIDSHQLQTTIHHPPSTIHHPPSTIHNISTLATERAASRDQRCPRCADLANASTSFLKHLAPHVLLCVRARACVHACVRACMRACMHACAHVSLCARSHTWGCGCGAYPCVCISAHVAARECICYPSACICACTHVHVHAPACACHVLPLYPLHA